MNKQGEAEESFLCLFVLKRKELAQPVLTKTFLQPAKVATMCTACTLHVLKPAHLTLSNLFASAKTYLQNRFHHATDNMWPKFHMMSTFVIRVLIHK